MVNKAISFTNSMQQMNLPTRGDEMRMEKEGFTLSPSAKYP